MALWNERKPELADALSGFPSMATNQAVSFRQNIEKHSFWTDSSGLSAGIPRLSEGSFGPGSARAFFAPESSLSTAFVTQKAMSGRLYIASDTSRLFGFTSTGTVRLGGPNSVVYLGASGATLATDTRVQVLVGTNSVITTGSHITFSPVFGAVPAVQLTAWSSGTTSFAIPFVSTLTVGGMTVGYTNLFGSPSPLTVLWRSHGTVAL